MRAIQKVNNNEDSNQVKLTIEELKKFNGFETISNSEAEEIIDSLFRLAIVMYNINK